VRNKLIYFAAILILISTFWLTSGTVNAANTYKGEFISFTYSENGKPNAVTIIDQNNRRVKHNMASDILYFINGRPTNEKTFKKGMEVSLVKNGNVITELLGIEEITGDAPLNDQYQVNGIVTKIDPNGMFITVKPDYLSEQDYYINRNTRFLKNNTVSDLNMLYEGDRVKMKFPTATTSTIYELEIMNAGVLVENIYKATLKSADAYRNTFTVSNAQPFENWMFGASVNNALATFTFTNETSIYAGNMKIKKEEFRNYVNKEFYFATIKQFGKEIVKKIVILQENERTYYDHFKSINTNYNLLTLNTVGNIYYHGGSILIRNGRLVEPTTLTSYGTAFLITDGVTRGNYAHVVNVTNDGFMAPNLANHDLYFGELSFVDTDNYLLELNNAVRLEQNYWKSVDDQIIAFSNGTSANLNYNSQVIKLIPNMDLWEYETLYGYFYVKNGHVQALHLLDPSQEKTSQVLTGTVASVSSSSPTFIQVKNVSQWLNGGWAEALALENVNLAQTLILKNGKVITASQIKASDRVVLLTTNSLETQVLLVNE
jgi:hypothetical protein